LIALEIVAATSPLLGLLGTVLGMVTVFNAINAEGLGNAQVLSGGISEALITTVTGLIVAIPALAFYSYFSKRVESLANELHEIGTLFIARLVDGQREVGGSDRAPEVGAARVVK
jgi:biopolymer transport protein ExbB